MTSLQSSKQWPFATVPTTKSAKLPYDFPHVLHCFGKSFSWDPIRAKSPMKWANVRSMSLLPSAAQVFVFTELLSPTFYKNLTGYVRVVKKKK
jgi:hypothetical protein